MVDWMVEVTTAFALDQRTIFLSVSIMDQYLRKEKKKLESQDLHTIGVCAMWMASKYEDMHPVSLRSAVNKIAHGAMTREQLMKAEIRIFKTLGFTLSLPTPFDFIELLISNMKVNGEEIGVRDSVKQKATYLALVALHNTEFLSFHPSHLASACLYAALVHEQKTM